MGECCFAGFLSPLAFLAFLQILRQQIQPVDHFLGVAKLAIGNS